MPANKKTIQDMTSEERVLYSVIFTIQHCFESNDKDYLKASINCLLAADFKDLSLANQHLYQFSLNMLEADVQQQKVLAKQLCAIVRARNNDISAKA